MLLQSDNLDVLVRSCDFQKAGALLKQLNYVSLRNIQEEHKEFYRKFIGNYVVGPVHLHEKEPVWAVPFDNNTHLWANMLQSDNNKLVYYPGYEDAILRTLRTAFWRII